MRIKSIFSLSGFMCLLLLAGMVKAQTVSTMGGTNYTGANGVGGASTITFVVENNTGGAIFLTDVEHYFQTASNNATITLWYSATSLSGNPTIATPAWTAITSNTLSVPANGVVPCFTGMTFQIPNATQYRFAIQSTNSIRYSGATPVPSPSTFTNAGVTLKVGDAQVAGGNVGVGGSFPNAANNPRWFTGLIKFAPAFIPCANPLVPGTATASATAVCIGATTTLDVTGHTPATNQTYEWESAAAVGGPYTSMGAATSTSAKTTTVNTTTFYRALITCGTATAYTTPVQVVTYNQLGGNYTINAANPTGGTNFQTFKDAVNVLKCGITSPVVFDVSAATGPYNEQVIIPQIPGTSATNTVTFNGNGRTLSFNGGVDAERAVVKLDGADFVTFNDLVVSTNGATYGYGFHLLNNADNNTIKNCTINASTTATGVGVGGIIISGSATSPTATGSNCDNTTIINNTITGGHYGITVYGSTTARSTGNLIARNLIREFYSYGINTSYTSGMVIDSNTITRPTRTSTAIFYGISLDNAFGTTVNKNRIHNPLGGQLTATPTLMGINLQASDPAVGAENKFTNNLIYDFTGGGLQYGIYNDNSDNAQYYHNTISLEHTANTGAFQTQGFFQIGPATNIDFKNNIVKVTRGGLGSKYCLNMMTATTNFTSDRNVLVMPKSPTNIQAVGFFNGVDRLSLADWQIATGKDANSVDNDPLFTNPATGDFTPTSGAVNDIGVPAGVTVDITNAARSTSPDPGAFEFTPPACTAPPVAGAATASPSRMCTGGGTIVLDVVGNSLGAAQTYQWQQATTIGGTYTNVGASNATARRIINNTASMYYRVAITCGGNTTVSTPVYVGVSGPLSGVYTINPLLPASAVNFLSFTDAVNALKCGVSGPVTFEAAGGTYNDQFILNTITGASATNRVRFVSATSNPSDVTVAFTQLSANNNYIVRLNNASFITFQGITFQNTNATSGRIIDIVGTSASDSIADCKLLGPSVTTNNTNTALIFANGGTGANIAISGNELNYGNYGIYVVGSTATLPADWKIENNTIINGFTYGALLQNTSNLKFRNNEVGIGSTAATQWCLNLNNCDNALEVTGNRLFAVTPGIRYGIFITGNNGTATTRGLYANNVIVVGVGSANNAFGIRSDVCTYQRFYNNSVSVNNGGTTGSAGYFTFNATQNNNEVFNNVFHNRGIGPALTVTEPAGSNTNLVDYNNNYAVVDTIIARTTTPAADHKTLSGWRIASNMDRNSISYDPGFASITNLMPDPGNPASWSLNGRGVHIAGNSTDITGAARVVNRADGVPDLGAYEFVPTSQPPVAVAIPAFPANGITQTFLFGQDTVARIVWNANSLLPPNVTVRQYTGTVPPQLQTANPNGYMYFYTDIDVAPNTYDFNSLTYYKDPWMGVINTENAIRLVKSYNNNPWVAYNDATSTVDVNRNTIAANSLTNHGYFSGTNTGGIFSSHITLGGKAVFCPSGTVKLFAHPSTGYNYQWRFNGVAIPGATLNSYDANSAGMYSVDVIDGTSNVARTTPVEVFVVATPTSVVTASGSTHICAGNSVLLTVNTSNNATYKWRLNGAEIPGAFSPTYTATTPGTYTAQATNIGCTSLSSGVTVTIGQPSVYIGRDTAFCQNATLVLDAGNPGATYQWSTGATTRTISITGVVDATYTVKVTTGPGCDATDDINVKIHPLPSVVGISYIKSANNYRLAPSGELNADKYLWIFGDGQTDTSKIITHDYTYRPNSVKLVVYNACGSDTVEAKLALSVQDLDQKSVALSLYPNPAQSQLNVNVEGVTGMADVVIINNLGQVVYKATVANNAKAISLDIANLANGHYMLRVNTADNTAWTFSLKIR